MKRRKVWLIAGAVILVVLTAGGNVIWRHVNRLPVEVHFLRYTNGPNGQLAAVLQIRNRGSFRLARNACRITPQPSGDKGFWYAAEVPSRRLEPDQKEEILISFRSGPMTHWRATTLYVRNPTSLESDLLQFVEWLSERGLSLPRVHEWTKARCSGQVTTEWFSAPSTDHDS